VHILKLIQYSPDCIAHSETFAVFTGLHCTFWNSHSIHQTTVHILKLIQYSPDYSAHSETHTIFTRLYCAFWNVCSIHRTTLHILKLTVFTRLQCTFWNSHSIHQTTVHILRLTQYLPQPGVFSDPVSPTLTVGFSLYNDEPSSEPFKTANPPNGQFVVK
jgi:hypothetical protein